MTLKSLKRQVYFLLILTILLGFVLVQKSFASCTAQTVQQAGGCSSGQPYGCPSVSNGNTGYTCVRDGVIFKYCQYNAYNGGYYPAVSCSNSSEANAYNECELSGGVWDNTTSTCKTPVDSTACDSYRAECESRGGRFTGTVTDLSSTGCSSSCNLCNDDATLRYRKTIAYVCCSQGKVPPEYVTSCQTDNPSPTMTKSYFDCDNRGGYNCECEPRSDDNEDFYQTVCIDADYDWGDESSSSAGGGESSSSSSAEESSASESPYPEGCDECSWLDSILDTLTLVKWNADAMVACMTTPGLCLGLHDTTGQFSVDSILLDYIRPLLDSSIVIDSAQLKVLSKLDTNMVKMLRNDTALQELDSASLERLMRIDASLDRVLENDSSTRRAVRDGFDDVGSALEGIAQDLGISTDSVIAHLDSILNGIPDSVLDSIVKYQAYANESIDSAIYGTGKGFSLVDSLIDSTVKYFSRAVSLDSAWRETWADSTSRMIDYMRWQPGAINSALGYGDTASSTLRGDLDGIRGALDGIGDALGGIDSALGGDGEALEGEGYDDYSSDSSAYMSVLDSAYGAGEFSDSTVDDAYNVGVDDSDTCFSVDCLASRVGVDMSSASSLLYASIDSSYDAMEDSADTWFTQIKDNLKFVDFDSVFVEPLKNVVPNTNECPADCFGGQVEVAGTKINVNYGICKVWNIGGFQFSVLLFIRLLLRIVCAVSCIYIGLWYIAGRKT